MNLPPDIPPEAAAFLQGMGYFDADRLKVGDAAPLLTLKRLDGSGDVSLGMHTTRPVVLIFGSYT